MKQRRMLYSGLIALTLGFGVVIGTVVSERATATQDSPAQLVIPDPVQLSNIFSQIAEQLGPTVVNIEVESTVEAAQIPDLFDFFGGNPFGLQPDIPEDQQAPQARSTGSGFIVDPSGYIVTNRHVIDGASRIKVQLQDDAEFEATVVGEDEETDLAVIRIETNRTLPAVRMGNSDSAGVGDWVLALGSPFGFDQSLTAGIVSAKGRDVPGGQVFQRFIQTDAAINPGNSGGPLVNMSGEVIGVNTAIISNTRQFAGLGFAMPSNVVADVYNQIVTRGRVSRGYIGIQMNGNPLMTEAAGVDEGVFVDSVSPGGPSESAGMQTGDVIVAVNGIPTPDNNDLLQAVASQRVGATVPITVVRAGEERTLNVVVADRAEGLAAINGTPAPTPRGGRDNDEETATRLGIRVRSIPAQVRGLPGGRDLSGVIVASVEPSSVAADAGLRRDMIISQVTANGEYHEIAEVSDFVDALGSLAPGTTAAFRVHYRPDQGTEFIQTYLPFRVP